MEKNSKLFQNTLIFLKWTSLLAYYYFHVVDCELRWLSCRRVCICFYKEIFRLEVQQRITSL